MMIIIRPGYGFIPCLAPLRFKIILGPAVVSWIDELILRLAVQMPL